MARNRQGRITLKEVARLAGVSIATVSYVLNDTPKSRSISEETSLRIKRIAREYDFVPNKAAISLKQGRHDLIALIAPQVGDFFAGLLEGIEGEGERHGFQILTASTFGSAERERDYLKRLFARRVDGIILLPLDVEAEHLQDLCRNAIPTVLFRRRAESRIPLKFMTFHDVRSGYLMTRHLIERGCTRIAFCTETPVFERDYYHVIHNALVDGCRSALVEAGFPFGPEQIVALDLYGADCEEKAEKKLFKRRFDGIVGLNDAVCGVVLRALHGKGIGVPQEVKICCFGDSNMAQFAIPSLTAISFDKTKLGKAMMDALFRMIDDDLQEADEVLIEPELIERESTAD